MNRDMTRLVRRSTYKGLAPIELVIAGVVPAGKGSLRVGVVLVPFLGSRPISTSRAMAQGKVIQRQAPKSTSSVELHVPGTAHCALRGRAKKPMDSSQANPRIRPYSMNSPLVPKGQ